MTEVSEWWSKNFIPGGYKGAWGCSTEEIESFIGDLGFNLVAQIISLDACRTSRKKRPKLKDTGVILIGGNPAGNHFHGVAVDLDQRVYALVGSRDVHALDSRWMTADYIDISPDLGVQIDDECGALLVLVWKWFLFARTRALKTCDCNTTELIKEAQNLMATWKEARCGSVGVREKVCYEVDRLKSIQNQQQLLDLLFPPSSEANREKRTYKKRQPKGSDAPPPRASSRLCVKLAPAKMSGSDDEDSEDESDSESEDESDNEDEEGDSENEDDSEEKEDGAAQQTVDTRTITLTPSNFL